MGVVADPHLPNPLIHQIHMTRISSLPLLLSLWCIFLRTDCQAQTLRICSYNMEDRPTSASDDQNMRIVMQAVGSSTSLGNAHAVDILAFQEGPENIREYSDIENNMEAVFGGSFASSITPPDFFGCRTGFVYNQDTVQLLNAFSLTGSLTHNCRRAMFRPVGGSATDDFLIYSIHLKAGSIDPADAATRAAEANLLRNNANTFAAGTQVIFCGDFNMTGSQEMAYQNFFAPGTNASAVETLNTPFGFLAGAPWRDDRAFLPFHTQDPTASMDDRFDGFFVNGAVVDGANFEYLKGSCSVLGNNGTHNLNQNINTGSGTIGFGAQLVALSDHLPVFCDFKWGATVPKFSSSLGVNASATRFIRQTGMVGGAAANTDLEVEGTSNGNFAAFAIVDFDMSGQLGSGEFVGSAQNVVLNMLQDNENFTDGGPVEIYVATAAASQVPIDGTIQYQSGQNGIDCVPNILSTGAQRVAIYAGVHELDGTHLPDGSVDPMALFGAPIDEAVSNALNSNGILRLLLVPAIAQTASTYAGFESALGAPSLSADLVFSDGSIDITANSFNVVNGMQGSGIIVDLNMSDDDRVTFIAEHPTGKADSPVRLVFNGSFQNLSPDSLRVCIEGFANSPNVELSVEMFDFANGVFEALGSTMMSATDSVLEFEATGDVSRFVSPGNTVITQVDLTPNGPVFFFPWSIAIDQFKWSITQ